MKMTALLMSSALIFSSATALAAPTIGKPAPDATLRDSTGAVHQISDLHGMTVVLEWTNHDCPFVKKHYESDNMQSLQRKAAENEVVWLTIISSAPGKQGHVTPEQANALTASRNAAPSAVILDEDGSAGKLYDAKTTPHMYVINPAGALVYAGGIDSIPSADTADIAKAVPHLELAMVATAAGKDVPVATSRPYGCSIKYAD
jgi:peroxiredoxin